MHYAGGHDYFDPGTTHRISKNVGKQYYCIQLIQTLHRCRSLGMRQFVSRTDTCKQYTYIEDATHK